MLMRTNSSRAGLPPGGLSCRRCLCACEVVASTFLSAQCGFGRRDIVNRWLESVSEPNPHISFRVRTLLDCFRGANTHCLRFLDRAGLRPRRACFVVPAFLTCARCLCALILERWACPARTSSGRSRHFRPVSLQAEWCATSPGRQGSDRHRLVHLNQIRFPKAAGRLCARGFLRLAA